jgi:hypothetical protein
MQERRNVRKIRLTRHIILDGEHAEKDSVFNVSRPLAARLIGEGSAVDHLEEGDVPEPSAGVVNRMEHPTNTDPKPEKLSGPTPKVKREKDDKK